MSETITTKALLFDMDGVLISSIGSANRCWRAWAVHYGVPGAETLQIAHGTRAVEIMQTFIPAWRTDPDRDTLLRDGLRLIEDMEIADVADLKVMPGVRELLRALPQDRWTIVTSATRRLLLGRLRAAQLPVPERIITADDVVNGKPHPEPYIMGARLLGFTPAECVVVEDAPTGVGSGVAAGCRVLGVLGTHAAEELRTAGATWVAESLEGAGVEVTAAELRLTFALSG